MALARGASWSSLSTLLGLGAAILVCVSIHFGNEYADYETDKLTKRTPYSGGSGALQDSGLDKNLALSGAILAMILGFTIAFFAFLMGHLTLQVLTILGLAAFFGWGYSLKPLKLAWRGWGEIDNALLGAWLLPIYGYSVIHHRVDTLIMAAAAPFAMLAFLNLLATHWADQEADRAVGKYTLVTKISIPQLRILYLLTMLGAYVGSLALPIFAVGQTKQLYRRSREPLGVCQLYQTAQSGSFRVCDGCIPSRPDFFLGLYLRFVSKAVFQARDLI